MTDNPAEDQLAYVRYLILARCPELSEAEIAEAFSADDLDRMPAGITEQVLDVIAALADRMDEMEGRLTPGRLN
jgi:hypothetical protein